MATKIKVCIADDHPIFLSGLKGIIDASRNFEVVGEAKNGEEMLKLCELRSPDIVLLDIDMPVMNGLEAAKALKEKHPLLPIAMLTMHNSKGPFDAAMNLGIHGYVIKENAILDVINCLDALSEGQKYVSPDVQRHFQSKKREDQALKDRFESLTKTEIQVLAKVAAYKTSQEIADTLFVTRKTISNHRNNIARKLDLKGNHSLLRFAIEHVETINDLTKEA